MSLRDIPLSLWTNTGPPHTPPSVLRISLGSGDKVWKTKRLKSALLHRRRTVCSGRSTCWSSSSSCVSSSVQLHSAPRVNTTQHFCHNGKKNTLKQLLETGQKQVPEFEGKLPCASHPKCFHWFNSQTKTDWKSEMIDTASVADTDLSTQSQLQYLPSNFSDFNLPRYGTRTFTHGTPLLSRSFSVQVPLTPESQLFSSPLSRSTDPFCALLFLLHHLLLLLPLLLSVLLSIRLPRAWRVEECTHQRGGRDSCSSVDPLGAWLNIIVHPQNSTGGKEAPKLCPPPPPSPPPNPVTPTFAPWESVKSFWVWFRKYRKHRKQTGVWRT